MALVKCSECQKEISDKAEVCPHCGNPMHTASTTININTPDVVKVEPVLVSKTWKKVKLVSAAIIFVGFLSIGYFGPRGLTPVSFLIMFIGFMTAVVAKIGAWYEDRTVR